MNMLSALSFTTPLALAALLLLPVIWWLLRFTPPRPETVRFPPIRLLLGLANREEQPDKTPWWLLLLRLLVAALLILAVSHPLYAPGRVGTLSSQPLLLVERQHSCHCGLQAGRQGQGRCLCRQLAAVFIGRHIAQLATCSKHSVCVSRSVP